jgi:hypothetical protein
LYILKSPLKANKGYLKVAGLFYSKKKCPIQANPYPEKTAIGKYATFKVIIISARFKRLTVVPTK